MYSQFMMHGQKNIKLFVSVWFQSPQPFGKHCTKWAVLHLLSSTHEYCVTAESGDTLAFCHRNPLGSAIRSGYPSL